ncbi:uncharacterized protein LOC129723236 isoform X2 [Wyeomyia smithii]|uniref:uncharacterized protein LOC129723236 isoform X2 n=1 Tax=Wyeomyia smithii TaxID=174621 RepID=UPI002467FCE3|nr:uncharacterized protein LOC129723236 isoform X2 [Wyeomyia smithii]
MKVTFAVLIASCAIWSIQAHGANEKNQTRKHRPSHSQTALESTGPLINVLLYRPDQGAEKKLKPPGPIERPFDELVLIDDLMPNSWEDDNLIADYEVYDIGHKMDPKDWKAADDAIIKYYCTHSTNGKCNIIL